MTDSGQALTERYSGVVTPLFESFCQEHNIVIMTSAIDKYGSTVWEGGQPSALNRYITFAITPVAVSGTGSGAISAFYLSVLIGADDGRRFVSRLGREWMIDRSDFLHDLSAVGLAHKSSPTAGWGSGRRSNELEGNTSENHTHDSRGMIAAVTAELSDGWKKALQFTEDDLDSEYLLPR